MMMKNVMGRLESQNEIAWAQTTRLDKTVAEAGELLTLSIFSGRIYIARTRGLGRNMRRVLDRHGNTCTTSS
jgi:hypothetical protein